MSKRHYVVAGGLSGDAHDAGLLRAAKSMVPALEIHGAAILGMLFLAACGKPSDREPPTVRALGYELTDLVFAANAPIFDPGGAPFVEAVWTDGMWKIHDDGVWIADGANGDAIDESMKGVRDKRPESRILISAEKDSLFREITTLIRGAARAGFWRIDFLVNSETPDSGNHAFHLELPTMLESVHAEPEIDPFVISVDTGGAVYTGTGASRQIRDSATTDHTLPELNEILSLYAAAARAAQCEPVCQINADPAVNYQRVIDVMSRLNQHGITDVFLLVSVIKPPGPRQRIELHRKLRIKPSPPHRHPKY